MRMKEISSSLKLILCCLILTGSLSGEARLFAQEIGCYQNLAFKDFLAAKVENDTDFVRAVYSNIQFPVEARKIEAQAIIEVLLINHNEGELEIIQVTPDNHFAAQISNLKKAIPKVKLKRNEPFMTRFYIYFDIEPFRYRREEYKAFHLGLINYNMFTIQEYIVPEIEHHK